MTARAPVRSTTPDRSRAALALSPSEIIQGFPLVTQVTIFDVYSGKQVAAGKKSLAYHLLLQSDKKTLTDKDGQKFLDNLDLATRNSSSSSAVLIA